MCAAMTSGQPRGTTGAFFMPFVMGGGPTSRSTAAPKNKKPGARATSPASCPMSLSHLDSFARHPLVFLTVCTARHTPVLNHATAHAILHQLWLDARVRNGWCVGRYVVMPDHVHLFAMPGEKPMPLRQWITTWKSISARKVVAALGTSAPIWQRDYFDRYLRTRESYGEKWDYVCNNPVRAGLVSRVEDWPYQGVIYDLQR